MNLMTVMKMRREPCLPRPLKEDVASVGSLDTRQWTVDPAVGSTTTTTRVGMSLPCTMCQRALRKHGLSKAVFTTEHDHGVIYFGNEDE